MLSAGSHGVRKGQQGPGVPWWAQIARLGYWLGPGNTNVHGWISTRYTLPVLPTLPVPGIPPSRYPPASARYTEVPVMPLTAVLDPTKEILGVNNAPIPGTVNTPATEHCSAAPH